MDDTLSVLAVLPALHQTVAEPARQIPDDDSKVMGQTAWQPLLAAEVVNALN